MGDTTTALGAQVSAYQHLLAELDEAQKLTLPEVIKLGITRTEARKLLALAAIYSAPSAHPAKQRRVRAMISVARPSLERLHIIEKYASTMAKTSANKAWELRIELASLTTDENELRRRARALIKAVEPPKPEPEPCRELTVTHHEGTTDATLKVRGPSTAIRTIQALSAHFADSNNSDLVDGFIHAFHEGSVRFTPKILIPLPDHLRILSGDGDDIQLVTTHGAVMTGRDYMQQVVNKHYETVLLSNIDDPVSISTTSGKLALKREDLEEAETTDEAVAKATERYASDKDRALLEAVHTTCAGEGCCQVADRCQTNHNIPFSNGGLTLLPNLTFLCRFHNGLAQNHEHYRNINGVGHRIYPGNPPVANQHPLFQKGGMHTLFGEVETPKRGLNKEEQVS